MPRLRPWLSVSIASKHVGYGAVILLANEGCSLAYRQFSVFLFSALEIETENSNHAKITYMKQS